MANIIRKLKKTYYKLRVRPLYQNIDFCREMPGAGYHSQYCQDKFVAELLDYKKNGVFVEIGVGEDGIFLSNTCFFERTLGWTGLLIEPHPKCYKKIQENRAGPVIQACVSDVDGTANFLAIDGYSQALSGIVDDYDKHHEKRIARETLKHNCSQEIVSVPCLRFGAIMAEHGITKIDYLSIDTEGSEMRIISDINFDSVDIQMLSVENNYRSMFFYNFLTARNYQLVAILGHDEIYRKKS